MPADAGWLILVGDLTAMPAMARITETVDVPTRVWAEVPDDLGDYLPDGTDVHLARDAGRRGQPAGVGGRGDRLAARARATSGWRASPRRCARSAST